MTLIFREFDPSTDSNAAMAIAANEPGFRRDLAKELGQDSLRHPDNKYFVGLVNGELVGILRGSYSFSLGESEWKQQTKCDDEPVAQVHDLVIATRYRGNDYGKGMLKRFGDEAKSQRACSYLIVNVGPKSPCGFYEKLGMQRLHPRIFGIEIGLLRD